MSGRGFRARAVLLAALFSAALSAAFAQVERRAAARPLFGPSVEVDPGFPYYKGRSPESIAAEIRANGYRVVRYVVTADSAIDPSLLRAYHREGIGVWYSTFGNGAYTTRDLPAGWQAWRMVTRADLLGKPLNDGYTRLCLNNPAYRAWKKAQMARVLRSQPFDGVDIMEPHWPEYPGVESPAYACFCPHCKAAFTKMFPAEKELPDILHRDSPRSPSRNPVLWKRWLEFRHRSMTAFLNDLVNGKGGIREAAPRMKVCTWTLALSEKDGVRRMREDCGEDAAEIARAVRPDLHCFQTNWPDWVRAELTPDYVNAYRPFIAQIRAAAPKLPLMIQADIGSQKQNRRDWEWVHAFEKASAALDASNTTLYEYFIGTYMYQDPPRIAEVRSTPATIQLRFTKRVDPTQAGKPEGYKVSPGRVLAARVDGSIVNLTVQGPRSGDPCTVTATNIPDVPGLRLFDDRPATTLKEQTVSFICGDADAKKALVRVADAILAHQWSDGAIGQGRPAGGDCALIPYFSNFAAEGLVAAYTDTKDPEYLNAAKRWVAWFESHQNPDGTIYDYQGRSGAWKSKGTYDSTDSYAATFIELIHAINAARPDPAWLRARSNSLKQAVKAIRLTLQPNGLTLARPGWPVMYTMDNTETLRGLQYAVPLFTALGETAAAADARNLAVAMKAGIDTQLWYPPSLNYLVGLQTDGHRAEALDKWYPDAMANLMAIGWLEQSDRNRGLYHRYKAAFSTTLPKTARTEDDVEHLVWWGFAAQAAGDTKSLGGIRDLLISAYTLDSPSDHPALLGHICRLLIGEPK